MFMENKSEVKNSFIHWYDNASVLASLHPSKAWDEKMADPAVSVAIASSREVRTLCKKTEVQITAEYTDLLDFNLRDAFYKLNRKDIANPGGFSDIDRASPELKSFFECRKVFEKFIADDVSGHSEKSAQTSAFARWVSIANLLLKRHNYEAASLVLLRLSQIDMRLHLNKTLPEDTQKKLGSLNKFIVPSKNFKVMRDHMKSHHSKKDIPPTFLLSKDMTFLNEALGEDKNLNSKEISKKHVSYKNIVRKERILDQLFNVKHQAIPKRKHSSHQEAMFHRISEEYQEQLKLTQEVNLPHGERAQKEDVTIIPQTKAEVPLSLSGKSQSGVKSKLTKQPDLTKEHSQETAKKKTEIDPTEKKQADIHSERPKTHTKGLLNLSFFSSPELYAQEVIHIVAPYLKF
jgi:hypothetical protein